jgi:hypothetical protein
MAAGDRTEKRLNDSNAVSTQLGTTTTTVATVPSSTVYVVKQIIVCNTDTVDRTVSLATGTAATASNRFVSALPIGANDTVVLDTALVLYATETIQGLSDTASKVNVTVVGWSKEL